MLKTAAQVWVLIAAVLTAGVTARLGLWQMDRASQKSQLQALLDARRNLPVMSAEALPLDAKTLAEQVHRHIELKGIWLPAYTVYLENRQMQGRPGFFVITPLALPDGTAVLVQRGWLPRDLRDRTRVHAPPLSSGQVTLTARIAPPPARLYDFAGAVQGPVRQNLDVEAFALETGLRLRPVSVLELDDQGPLLGPPQPDRLMRDWPLPTVDIHKHHGYAFQWFALSAMTIALYVWFQVLRPRTRAASNRNVE